MELNHGFWGQKLGQLVHTSENRRIRYESNLRPHERFITTSLFRFIKCTLVYVILFHFLSSVLRGKTQYFCLMADNIKMFHVYGFLSEFY